jgi:hypothetical protein
VTVGGQTPELEREVGPEQAPEVPHAPPTRAHLVHFYETEDALASAVAKFVGGGLSVGNVVTTIATSEHTQAVQRLLGAAGVDVDAVRASGQLLILDAHETLGKVMRDGEPDPRLFEAVVGDLMAEREALASGAGMRAYGEMVDVLWKRGEKSAALRLEELWNDLQMRRSFALLCAYSMGKFYKEPATIHSVCATHTEVVGLHWDGEASLPSAAPSLPPAYTPILAREMLHREEVELALRQALHDLRSKEE